MTQAVSTRDGVGSGLTIMSAFGVFWAILGSTGLNGPSPLRIALIVIAVAAGWIVLRNARSIREAHAADAPERIRSPYSRQIFTWVNIAQSVLIVAAAATLGATRHGSFIPPAIALVVGLHFFPLVKAFGVSLYWYTGGVLCALAVLGAVVALNTNADSRASFITVGFPAAATLWTTTLLLARRG